MLTSSFAPVGDLSGLAARWCAFEQQTDCSFFQSWAWTGCLLEERFPDPVLLELRDGPRLVAMALFNRRADRLGRECLWLGESGRAEWDAAFIEYNGPLLARDAPAALQCGLAAVLQATPRLGRTFGRRIVLSGVDEAVLHAALAAGAVVVRRETRPAPYIDFLPIRRRGGAYLDTLSAGTRYQIRRSERRYATGGPLTLRRAETTADAHGFLDALAALHQRSWIQRGKPGAFANPAFLRFHHALIDRTAAQQQTDLLRIEAGAHVIGYLYNFRFRGRVSAYQSGFDYAAAELHQKPGLTCHHLAAEMYLGAGMDSYDFLAGEAQYKTSLSNASAMLHWLELAPAWSVPGLLGRLAAGWRGMLPAR
jgi:CelD/BcsL family acetyltransferase involved in cellulose biosynthesis